MKERTVAPWNQHIVYLCYLFWYHINPPSNRCSSRDFLCCLLSRYFLNGCRFDFLSLSPDLTSCPDRSTLFFLFQVVVTRGGMRRSASPRDAPHRIRSFLPLRLGFSSTWPTATRGNAGFNLEHYHQLTYESILHRHDRLSKRSQATLKPTKRGAGTDVTAGRRLCHGPCRRCRRAPRAVPPCPPTLLLLGLPWARASNRGRQAVSGNPELASGSKELAPEERWAVKILHAELLLQGPPPASTRKGRRLLERDVAAPDRKAASEARKHRTDGLEIEGAGARGAW